MFKYVVKHQDHIYIYFWKFKRNGMEFIELVFIFITVRKTNKCFKNF